ncbi:hypothetical protein CEXT_105221 [Caerostris extrusa]|uniref:C2H2-type domain-containing protein n=1 Tax=Caerostris extrusa TaxID=172846 RepID=A0AAV4MNI6_CAEEX|nr:hypothetical protein CEXT_105221 [Caerostris extrusa]
MSDPSFDETEAALLEKSNAFKKLYCCHLCVNSYSTEDSKSNDHHKWLLIGRGWSKWAGGRKSKGLTAILTWTNDQNSHAPFAEPRTSSRGLFVSM